MIKFDNSNKEIFDLTMPMRTKCNKNAYSNKKTNIPVPQIHYLIIKLLIGYCKIMP